MMLPVAGKNKVQGQMKANKQEVIMKQIAKIRSDSGL
jgi:hypothetical protein